LLMGHIWDQHRGMLKSSFQGRRILRQCGETGERAVVKNRGFGALE